MPLPLSSIKNNSPLRSSRALEKRPPLLSHIPRPRSTSWIQFYNPYNIDSPPFLELHAHQCAPSPEEDDPIEGKGVVLSVALFACEIKISSAKDGYLSTTSNPDKSKAITGDSIILTAEKYWFHHSQHVISKQDSHHSAHATTAVLDHFNVPKEWPQPTSTRIHGISIKEDPFAPGVMTSFVPWVDETSNASFQERLLTLQQSLLATPSAVVSRDGSVRDGFETSSLERQDNSRVEETGVIQQSPKRRLQDGIELSPPLRRLMMESDLVIVPLKLEEDEQTKWYSYVLGPVRSQYDIPDHHLVEGWGLTNDMAAIFLAHFAYTVTRLQHHELESLVQTPLAPQGTNQPKRSSSLGHPHTSEDNSMELLSKRQKIGGTQSNSDSSSQSSSGRRFESSDQEEGGEHDETAITLDESPQRLQQTDLEEGHGSKADSGGKEESP